MTTETLVVPNDRTPVDLLLVRRFKREVPGLVEKTLAMNPGLAEMAVFPPAGTKVLVEIPAPAGRQTQRPVITLWS